MQIPRLPNLSEEYKFSRCCLLCPTTRNQKLPAIPGFTSAVYAQDLHGPSLSWPHGCASSHHASEPNIAFSLYNCVAIRARSMKTVLLTSMVCCARVDFQKTMRHGEWRWWSQANRVTVCPSFSAGSAGFGVDPHSISDCLVQTSSSGIGHETLCCPEASKTQNDPNFS